MSAISKIKSAVKSGATKAKKIVTRSRVTASIALVEPKLPLVSIRFSTQLGLWVTVDPKNVGKVIGEIRTPSFIEDATFSASQMRLNDDGCGARSGWAGVATGKLHAGKPAALTHVTDFQNLGFASKGGTAGFMVAGKELTSAKWVMLENDRFATVRVK